MARVPLLCQWLLNAASLLVPRELRVDWRREWYGELWHFIGARLESGDRQAYRVALTHCVGAWSDAWHLRREDEASAGELSRILRHPAFCIAALALLAAIVGAASGGFANTRRMIASLPYRDPSQIMVIRQTGYFMGARLGLPKGKVSGWRKAESLEGIAGYVGYHALVETNGWTEVEAAAVDADFFGVLGVKAQLGSLFHEPGARNCGDCVVISDQLWRSEFHGDASIVGGVRQIAGERRRIVGVLPRDFWFFAGAPGVWTLSDHCGFLASDRSLVYAIGRLRRGYTVDRALTELRKIYRTQPPVIKARQVELRSIEELTQDRMYRNLPLALVGLLVLSGGLVLVAPARKAALRGAAFYATKLSLTFLAAALAAIEFAYAPGLAMTGVRGFAPEAISLWVLIFGLVISVWFAGYDQRRRCRICLARLSMPVQMGARGHVLMDRMSTELACPNGHGLLWAPEDPLESHPKDRWLRLDESWQDLFELSGKR